MRFDVLEPPRTGAASTLHTVHPIAFLASSTSVHIEGLNCTVIRQDTTLCQRNLQSITKKMVHTVLIGCVNIGLSTVFIWITSKCSVQNCILTIISTLQLVVQWCKRCHFKNPMPAL